MMMGLQRYNLQVTYKKGSQMYLADTLSRAYLPTTQGDNFEDIVALKDGRSEVEIDIECVNALQFLTVSEETLAQIKQATDVDQDTQSLKTIIRQGRPDTKVEIPHTPSLVRSVSKKIVHF